jgi:hypothetical protein
MDNISWLIAAVTGLVGILGSLCVVGLPILIIGGLVFYLYRQNKRSAAVRAAAQAWSDTTGTVVSSTIKVRRTGRSRSEVPVVVYQYVVNGHTYHGETLRAGDRFFSVRLAGQARESMARYPAGASVKVYYNPADPAESALER